MAMTPRESQELSDAVDAVEETAAAAANANLMTVEDTLRALTGQAERLAGLVRDYILRPLAP